MPVLRAPDVGSARPGSGEGEPGRGATDSVIGSRHSCWYTYIAVNPPIAIRAERWSVSTQRGKVTPVRYAVYLRVSTDQQADTGLGLEVQEQACRSWLRSNKHRLAGIFTDAGRSGTADVGDRPALAAALAALLEDKADGLLVYRLDRLARDLVLQEQVLAEMHRLGKELSSCSATEDANLAHAPDDPTRALVRRILGSIAAYERDVIRLRLAAGRRRKVLSGGWAGGGVPYGFTAVRGELVKVPAEQRAIRLMTRLVGEGWSYRRVCAELERRDMPSRAPGGTWHPNTVRGICLREMPRKAIAQNGDPSPELEKETA